MPGRSWKTLALGRCRLKDTKFHLGKRQKFKRSSVYHGTIYIVFNLTISKINKQKNVQLMGRKGRVWSEGRGRGGKVTLLSFYKASILT
jgi:hypothetical protein